MILQSMKHVLGIYLIREKTSAEIDTQISNMIEISLTRCCETGPDKRIVSRMWGGEHTVRPIVPSPDAGDDPAVRDDSL